MSNGTPAHGIFCWNELLTRDFPAAQKFYKELIGWEPTDSGMPGMDYKMLKNQGDVNAAGMMAMPKEVPEHVPSYWMAYITVDDVEASTKKAVELGGQVMMGPQDVPNMGRFSIIQDPTGASVGLFTFNKK